VSYSVAEKVEKSTEPRIEFTIPDYVAGESAVVVAPVGEARAVRTGEWLVFRGRYKLPKGSSGIGTIMLSFVDKRPDGEVIVNSGVAELERMKKQADGFWEYDLYVNRFHEPGKFALKVELNAIVKPDGGGDAISKTYIVSESEIEVVQSNSPVK
jgi:hypothetical protein